MNTARWIKGKKEKSVRRIPLFCSARTILEQLLEINHLRVIKVKENRACYSPDGGPNTCYVMVPKIVSEDYNDSEG